MGLIKEAVKAMFRKNTTNAASVTGARVPFVDITGNPIGNDSFANLASVLGAFVTLIASDSKTPDTFEGIASMKKNILMPVPTVVINTGKFQDMPERSFGFFINLFIGGSTLQFYVRDSTLKIYCRAINGGSGTVSGWYMLTNTPV